MATILDLDKPEDRRLAGMYILRIAGGAFALGWIVGVGGMLLRGAIR